MYTVGIIIYYKIHTFEYLFNYFSILKPYFYKQEDTEYEAKKIIYNNVPISILRNLNRINNVLILCDNGNTIEILEKVW